MREDRGVHAHSCIMGDQGKKTGKVDPDVEIRGGPCHPDPEIMGGGGGLQKNSNTNLLISRHLALITHIATMSVNSSIN